ncbi:MAG: hypothetical protein WDO73_02695 [Ignavibacteriota bacterium]
MSEFSDAIQSEIGTFQGEFGDPIIYQGPDGVVLGILAIRTTRSPDEKEQFGAFEGVDVAESDFLTGPSSGAEVTLSGVVYTVSEVRDPYPWDGEKTLVLNRK